MVKKLIEICKDKKWALDSENKLLQNVTGSITPLYM